MFLTPKFDPPKSGVPIGVSCPLIQSRMLLTLLILFVAPHQDNAVPAKPRFSAVAGAPARGAASGCRERRSASEASLWRDGVVPRESAGLLSAGRRWQGRPNGPAGREPEPRPPTPPAVHHRNKKNGAFCSYVRRNSSPKGLLAHRSTLLFEMWLSSTTHRLN